MPDLDVEAPIIGKLPPPAAAPEGPAPADLDAQAPIIGRLHAQGGAPLIHAPFVTPPPPPAAPIAAGAGRGQAEKAAAGPVKADTGAVGAIWRQLKSIPGGIVQGLADTAAASGAAAQTEMGQPITVPDAAASGKLLEENVTGPLPNEGRFGRAVGEVLGNPGSYVAPGSLPVRMAVAAGTGLASELGGDVAGQPGAIAGGLIGGGITGHVIPGAGSAVGAARGLAAGEHEVPAIAAAGERGASEAGAEIPAAGAGAGAGAPPGGPPAGGGAPPAPPPGGERGAAMVRSLDPEARAALKDAVDREGITAQNLEEKTADQHPAAMLGELGPSLTADMGALAGPPGAAKNEITAQLGARAAATKARLDGLLTDTFGAAVPPGQVVRNLKLAQAKDSGPIYDAWQNALVPPTPALNALLPRLEAAGAIQAAEKALKIEGAPAQVTMAPSRAGPKGVMLKTSGTDLGLGDQALAPRTGPTARAYDLMKQHLDDKVSEALDKKQNGVARRYGMLKDELVAAIDNHPDPNVAGVWKKGREAFQAPEKVIDAIRTGNNFFDPRLSLDELETKFAGAAAHQMEGLRVGMRAAAGHTLEGSVRGDANLRNKLSSIEAQRKIEWAIGKDAAAKFEAAIEGESKIAKAPQAIIGGSPTQPRQEAAKNWTVQPSALNETVGNLLSEKAGGPVVAGLAHLAGLEPMTALALGAGAHIAQKVRNAAAEKAMANVRDQVAPVMTLKGADAKGALHELLNMPSPNAGPGGGGQVAPPRPGASGAAPAVPAAAAAMAPAAKPPESLQAMLDRNAPKAELTAHPDYVAAVARSKSFPETTTLPGYGTPEFQAKREFNFGGEKVTGYPAAIDRLTRQAESYAGGPVGHDKEATIVIGPSASGKSTLSERIAKARKAAIADPDDAKTVIPEYRGGIGATAVHEESSTLGAGVLKNLIRDGKNVVIPRVGGSAEGIRAYRDALAEHGYKVNLVNLTVGSEEATHRMMGRFLKTGRIVGSDYMEKIGDKPRQTYATLKGEPGFAETANFDGNTRGKLAMIDGQDSSFARILSGDAPRLPAKTPAQTDFLAAKGLSWEQAASLDPGPLAGLEQEWAAGHPGAAPLVEHAQLQPSKIAADPERFQFRSNVVDKKSGVTDKPMGATWKENAGIVSWRGKDGQDYIVDGHHRLNFAKQLESAGEHDLKLNSIMLHEADGVTPQMARDFGQRRNEMRAAAKAARGEVPFGQGAAPSGQKLLGPPVPGMPAHRVTAADNTAIDVSPTVMEAGAVKTSADAGYDQALQPRQRDRAASQAQVREIAGQLDPARLGYSAEADRGAPIVGPDGMVESGNGRVLALRQVYGENGPAAANYRQWLAGQGVDVSKFKQPVLVRQRTSELTPEQRAHFTVAANQAATLAMSGSERALADARSLTGAALDQIRDPSDLGAAGNRDFVRSFMAGLPGSERGALMNAEGSLSAEGLNRMRNAVLAKAYGDSHVLTRIAEATDDEVKSISNGLTAATPAWAKLKAGVAAGEIRPDVDVTEALIEAVGKTADLRGRGQKLDSYLAQADAFNKLDTQVEAFMRMFYDPKGRRAAGAQGIARTLQLYAQEAAKVSADKGLDLGLAPVKSADILKFVAARSQNETTQQQPGLFGAARAG